MKKTVCLCLTALMLLSFAGCKIDLSGKNKTYTITVSDNSDTKSNEPMPVVSSNPSSVNTPSSAVTSSQKPELYTGKGNAPEHFTTYYAKVDSGYLAIRNTKSYNAENEIEKMSTGATVYVVDTSTGRYWYCYQPDMKIYGYVDSNYLVAAYPEVSSKSENAENIEKTESKSDSYKVWIVNVDKGFVGLRSSAERDSDKNIIGKLYSGDKVYVYDDSYDNFSDTYWYVYAPSLDTKGYIDSNYIWENEQ